MERFGDYTDKELLNMSDEDISRLVDSECAYSGIAMLPPYPEDPERFRLPYDKTVYSLFGFYFKSEVDARAVLSAFTSMGPRRAEGYHGYFDRREGDLAVDGYDSPTIISEEVYSPERWAEVRSSVRKHRDKVEVFSTLKEKYESIAKSREAKRSSITKYINEISDVFKRKQQIQSEYLAYLEIAEGDVEQAIMLLKKIYTDLSILDEKVLRLTKPVADEATGGRKLRV